VNLLRRHPVAIALVVLLLATAIYPLSPLIDAVTGSAPGDVDLERPILYILFAPLSNTLDALTFFSQSRAEWALAVWILVLAAWGALRRAETRLTWRRRTARALVGPCVLILLALAAVLLPRPVPRLTTDSTGGGTVLDYHAHTNASHDGRPGWTLAKLAAWHERQGFEASYVTDHNVVYDGSLVPSGTSVSLLPGVEWSVHQQHVVAIGPVEPLARDSFQGSTARMLRIFAAIERQGGLSIASLPEYWRYHWDDLGAFVAAGVDGFEIVNCAPRALAFPSDLRHQVLTLARSHDLMVVGASDNHGWGQVTCVWNVSLPGAQGFHTNRVFARPLALVQGDWKPWTAAVTQPWFLLRSLSWSERASWLTWVVIILLYRAMPRREGQGAGLGILARSLGRRSRRPPVPHETPT
jgi:hypothetical protein